MQTTNQPHLNSASSFSNAPSCGHHTGSLNFVDLNQGYLELPQTGRTSPCPVKCPKRRGGRKTSYPRYARLTAGSFSFGIASSVVHTDMTLPLHSVSEQSYGKQFLENGRNDPMAYRQEFSHGKIFTDSQEFGSCLPHAIAYGNARARGEMTWPTRKCWGGVTEGSLLEYSYLPVMHMNMHDAEYSFAERRMKRILAFQDIGGAGALVILTYAGGAHAFHVEEVCSEGKKEVVADKRVLRYLSTLDIQGKESGQCGWLLLLRLLILSSVGCLHPLAGLVPKIQWSTIRWTKRLRRKDAVVYQVIDDSFGAARESLVTRAYGTSPYLVPLNCPQVKLSPKQFLELKYDGLSGPLYGNPIHGKRCAAYAVLWAVACRLRWPALTYALRAHLNKCQKIEKGANGKNVSFSTAQGADLDIDAIFKMYWPIAVQRCPDLQQFGAVNSIALVETPLTMRILEALEVEWSHLRVGAGVQAPLQLAEHATIAKIVRPPPTKSSGPRAAIAGLYLLHRVDRNQVVNYHWLVDLKLVDTLPKCTTKVTPPTLACFAQAMAGTSLISVDAVQKAVQLYREVFGMPSAEDGGGAETTFEEAQFVLENHNLKVTLALYSVTTYLPNVVYGDPCQDDWVIGHNTTPANHWFLVQNQYRSALGWKLKKDVFKADIYYLPAILQREYGSNPSTYPNAIDWSTAIDKCMAAQHAQGLTKTTSQSTESTAATASAPPVLEKTVHESWTFGTRTVVTCDYRLPQWPLYRVMMRTVLEYIGFPNDPFMEAPHDYSRPLEFLQEVAQAQAWQCGVTLPGPLTLPVVAEEANCEIWYGLTRHGVVHSDEQFLHAPIAVTVGDDGRELYSGLEVLNWEELSSQSIVWWVPVSPHYRFVYVDKSRPHSTFNPLFQCSSWAHDLLRSETDAVSKSLLDPSRRPVLVNRTIQYSKFKCLSNTILSKGEAEILGDLGHEALTEQYRLNLIEKAEYVRKGLVRPVAVQKICSELDRRNIYYTVEDLDLLLGVVRTGVLIVRKVRRLVMLCLVVGLCSWAIGDLYPHWNKLLFLIVFLPIWDFLIVYQRTEWSWVSSLYIRHYLPVRQKAWCIRNLDIMQEEASFNLFRPNRFYHTRLPLNPVYNCFLPYGVLTMWDSISAWARPAQNTLGMGISPSDGIEGQVSGEQLSEAEMQCFWSHLRTLQVWLLGCTVCCVVHLFANWWIINNTPYLIKSFIQSGWYLDTCATFESYLGSFCLDPADLITWLLALRKSRDTQSEYWVYWWGLFTLFASINVIIHWIVDSVGMVILWLFNKPLKGKWTKAYGLGEEAQDIFMDISDTRYDMIDEGNRTGRDIKYYHPDGTQFPSFAAAKAYMRVHVDPARASQKWYRTGLKTYSTEGEVKPFILRQSSRNLFHAFHDRQIGVKSIETAYWQRQYEEIAKIVVKQWVNGILEYWNLNGLMSEEDYINSVPASKARVYRLGLIRWGETYKIDAKLELRQKNGEQHYDHAGKLRGRCFFNPGPVYKMLTGCYNKNVITAMRNIEPAFVHGLDCGELEDKLSEIWSSVEDPSFGDADGSSHDAHEHAWKIACVDHLLHEGLIGEYCARMGYDSLKTSEMKRVLLTVEYEFEAYYLGTRTKMISGSLFGSVFSGASTLTTNGNTCRTIVSQELVRFIAGLLRKNLGYGQSGDDQLQCCTRSMRKRYDAASRQVYLSQEGVGGIGYLVKVQNWGGNVFSFLSKTGGAAADRVVAHRMWHRTVIGGNYTRKLKKQFRDVHHRWAINSQLASWIGDLPVFGGYLKARMEMPTAIPKSRDVLWNDPERFWKSVSHANAHAGPGHFEPMAPFLYGSAYSVYSEYANSIGFYDHLEGIGYRGT